LISQYLSKELYKSRNIDKDEIEEYINYFYSLRYDLLYSTNYYLNKKTLQYLGYILSYIFRNFHTYQIKDTKELNQLIKSTAEKNIDSLTDYYNYINENNINESDKNYKKLTYWKKNKNKYYVPPELNFLFNRFIAITTVEIELDFQRDSIDDEGFKLISIFLLNIKYIFLHLEHLKINFMNQKFQYEIFAGYFQKLIKDASIKNKNNIIKKNRIKYPELIYDKKWNFQSNFNLEELRLIDVNKNKEEYDAMDLVYDDYNMLYINNKIKEVNEKQMLNSAIKKEKHIKTEINTGKKILKKQNTFNNLFIDKINRLKNNKMNHKIDENVKDKNIKEKIITDNNNYIDIIEKYKSFLDLLPMILISIGRLTKINALDIIMNDSYNNEFITHLVNSYDIDQNLIGLDFHILDFIYNKIKDLQQLNIELNALDAITFNKVLNIMSINDKLKSIRLSLFSSDVTYFRISLLKLYNQIYGGAEQLIKIQNVDIESKILKKFLPFFIRNLSVLFEIIKNDNNIEELGFNFDLPIIITNQHGYIISILKFIINIFFFN
jgi:hypothetical protein